MVQKDSLKRVLVICGPTASGKTSLAVECAKKLNGEVVSADSMYIYKNCNIGTAKPTIEEMDGIKHHMIDVISPFEEFSVGDYKDRALPIIEDVLSRGKLPIICGGTGFYINSLLFNYSYGNAPANLEIRKKYEIMLSEKGKEAIYEELRVKDLETAGVLHVNDVKRVVRALEIFETTGKRKSELNDGAEMLYDYVSFQIDYPREVLYERINYRVDDMMAGGLIEEVNSLVQMGVNDSCQAMQGIGYKEVYQGLQQGWGESEIAELIKFNTRHYAKRQITFFKRDPKLVYLNPDNATILSNKVMEIFNK